MVIDANLIFGAQIGFAVGIFVGMAFAGVVLKFVYERGFDDGVGSTKPKPGEDFKV